MSSAEEVEVPDPGSALVEKLPDADVMTQLTAEGKVEPSAPAGPEGIPVNQDVASWNFEEMSANTIALLKKKLTHLSKRVKVYTTNSQVIVKDIRIKLNLAIFFGTGDKAKLIGTGMQVTTPGDKIGAFVWAFMHKTITAGHYYCLVAFEDGTDAIFTVAGEVKAVQPLSVMRVGYEALSAKYTVSVCAAKIRERFADRLNTQVYIDPEQLITGRPKRKRCPAVQITPVYPEAKQKKPKVRRKSKLSVNNNSGETTETDDPSSSSEPVNSLTLVKLAIVKYYLLCALIKYLVNS